jgi:hypothetical protein
MEPVQKFDEKARVLHPEGANAEASLLLGAADLVPGDEALGARGAVVANPPEEGTTEGIESNDDCRRELQGSHRVRGQRVQDRIDEHEAPRRREQEGPPPRKAVAEPGSSNAPGHPLATVATVLATVRILLQSSLSFQPTPQAKARAAWGLAPPLVLCINRCRDRGTPHFEKKQLPRF